MAESGIITMEEYGNVRLKLKERMDSDGINRNTLARRIGVRFEVVDKWYRGDVEKLDLDILARICCVLHCTVGPIPARNAPPNRGERSNAALAGSSKIVQIQSRRKLGCTSTRSAERQRIIGESQVV